MTKEELEVENAQLKRALERLSLMAEQNMDCPPTMKPAPDHPCEGPSGQECAKCLREWVMNEVKESK